MRTETICQRCINDYYIYNNLCNLRTYKSITDCSLYTPNEDNCQQCISGFLLTTDRLSCKKVVANCKTYQISKFTQKELYCLECVDGFYLGVGKLSNLDDFEGYTQEFGLTQTSYYLHYGINTNICLKGTVRYCEKYRTFDNICIQCLNGYYLNSNNECIKHLAINQCKTYSQIAAHTCTECNLGYYPFTYVNLCEPVESIKNCSQYTADGKMCLRCETNFFVDAFGTCSSTNKTNCVSFNTNGECVLCNSRYVLFEGDCIEPFVFFRTNCESYDLTNFHLDFSNTTNNNINTAVCDYCATGSVPYKYQPLTAICVSKAQLAYYMPNGKFNFIPGCVKYNTNNECMQCDNAYPYLNPYASKGHYCMAACPQNSVIILDNLDGRTNLCVRKIFMGAMVGYLAVAPTVEMLGGFTSVSIAPFCRVAVRVAYYKSQGRLRLSHCR